MIKSITKIALSLLFLCAITGRANAQYVLQSSNLPGSGDIWVNKIINDANVQPGGSGAGTPWDFSIYFVTPNTISETYTIPTGTAIDQTFPTANLKCASVFGITEYYYKNAATNTLQYLGYYSPSNEVHITNPQTMLFAPMSFGTSSSNSAVTGTGYQGSTLTGTVSVVADAWGTLTVGGVTTANALRVRTEYNLTEDFGGGLSENIVFVKYAWYKQGLRAPYMQIVTYDATGDIGTISQKYTLVANVTVGVDELSKPTLSFSVFPNPVGDTAEIDITIDQNADMAIRLMDVAGKTVKTEKTYYTKGTHHLSMDVSDLPGGVYILSVKGGATLREEQILIAE
jgi:hypothetical protein